MERFTDGSTTSTCKSKVGNLDVGQPGLEKLFIGGDSFMQIFYTVFDRTENAEDGYGMGRVGFAKAKHTAPEELVHWTEDGHYSDTWYVCEESFVEESVCDNYP